MATFSRRRGRPKRVREMLDTGTPELVSKKRAQLTTEPIDLCLARGIITPPQHHAGVHLRWLHTLRLGAPGVRACDVQQDGPARPVHTDEIWLAERQQEYRQALELLKAKFRLSPVINLCIYNQIPSFLFPPSDMTALRAEHQQQEIRWVCEGLEILHLLWKQR